MEVAVLVVMPGAAHRAKQREGADEEELPHVEVGMTEIVVSSPLGSAASSTQEGSSSIGPL
jgi:hypothetical protein